MKVIILVMEIFDIAYVIELLKFHMVIIHQQVIRKGHAFVTVLNNHRFSTFDSLALWNTVMNTSPIFNLLKHCLL